MHPVRVLPELFSAASSIDVYASLPDSNMVDYSYWIVFVNQL